MSPINNPDITILTDLVKDAIRRIDNLGDRVDNKLEIIEAKLREDSLRMSDALDDRIKGVENSVKADSDRITKIEQTAHIFSWLITGGIASFVALLGWITNLPAHFFQHK